MKEIGPGLLEKLAGRFAVLADVTRLRLLHRLKEGEARVMDLAEALGLGQPSVSKHLAHLRAAGLVSCCRQGNEAWYSIADESLFELCEMVCASVEAQLRSQLSIMAPSSRRRRGGQP